jgi:IclR family acetate operon transcriptional repressor
MTLAELARATGVPHSTVLRFTRFVEGRGLLRRESGSRRYLPGETTLGLTGGTNYFRLAAVARPHIEALVARTGETGHLCVLDGDRAYDICPVEPSSSVRVCNPPDHRHPLHTSSCGKVLLSSLSDEEVRAFAKRSGLPRSTSKTITDVNSMIEEIHEVRAQGFAIDDQEGEEGVRCIAAPVFSPDGAFLAAVGISSVAWRLPKHRLRGWGGRLQKVAWAISSDLGRYLSVTPGRRPV